MKGKFVENVGVVENSILLELPSGLANAGGKFTVEFEIWRIHNTGHVNHRGMK